MRKKKMVFIFAFTGHVANQAVFVFFELSEHITQHKLESCMDPSFLYLILVIASALPH